MQKAKSTKGRKKCERKIGTISKKQNNKYGSKYGRC